MATITRIYLGGKPSKTLRSANFSEPIEMYSIAMDNDDDIKAFMSKAPDVAVSLDQDDPMYGIPIARNRQQKLQALQAARYTETN